MATTRSGPLIIEGVWKKYGDVAALTGIDLRIDRGELVALLGRNGAGKSTLISIIAGLTRVDAGTVTLAGQRITTRQSATKRLIGVAPQNTSVYPTLTVRQNLRCFGELSGLRRQELSSRMKEVASALAIWDLRDRRARDLSVGEQRRLHTAMAFVHRPRLLLLDEPTMAADAQSREHLIVMIRRLVEDGSAVFYSTHHFEEVVRLGASAVILERGAIVAQGSVTSLVAEHSEATIEMRFDGLAPRLTDRAAKTRGDRVSLTSGAEPESDLAAVIADLGGSARRLRSIELVRPSLESVFLKLTDGGSTDASSI
jgi:ABC-2 type transport system ATP-binding protein